MDSYLDFIKYRDEYGLNGLDTNGIEGLPTQNGALFTIEYLLCLLADHNIPESIKVSEVNRLKSVYLSLERFPGVSVRTPPSHEFDSMDNVGAICAFSGLFDDGGFSKRSYEHGATTRAEGIEDSQDSENSHKYYFVARALNLFRAPRFFWNNNHPKLFCFAGWHGRSPGHIAFMKMTAGKWVGPFGQLAILVSQFIGCFSDVNNTDARKLPYVNWQFLKHKNFVWKLLYKLWCHILMKQYVDGMKTVYTVYYRDPSHPLPKYSPKYID